MLQKTYLQFDKEFQTEKKPIEKLRHNVTGLIGPRAGEQLKRQGGEGELLWSIGL